MRVRAIIGALAALALAAAGRPAVAPASATCCTGGSAAISADGSSLYFGADGGGIQLDPATGAVVGLTSYPAFSAVPFLPTDGRVLYAVDEDELIVERRDPVTRKLTQQREQLFGGRVLGLSADDRWLYIVPWSGTALASVPLDPVTREIDGPAVAGPDLGDAWTMAVWPDGKTVDVGLTSGGVVDLRVGPGGTLVPGAHSGTNPVSGLLMRPDGRRLYGDWGQVFDRDPDTGELTTETPSPQDSPFPTSHGTAAFSPDSRFLYLLDPYGISEWRVTETGLVRERSYTSWVGDVRGLDSGRSLAVSPDGRFVYVEAGESGLASPVVTVLARDPATGALSFRSTTPFRAEGIPDPQPTGLVINGGAAYTNDPHVRLTVKGEFGGYRYRFANDAGFAHAKALKIPEGGGPVPWTLASTGPESLPKFVYMDAGFNAASIVLDERPPVVTAAQLPAAARAARDAKHRVLKRTVRVLARDDNSGVAAIQITARRSHPGRWQRLRRSKTYPVPRGAAWVRVRDRAGNASAWRQARAARRNR